MMDFTALYKSKLTTPAAAVGRIASGEKLSMGMAVTEPPALLKASRGPRRRGQGGRPQGLLLRGHADRRRDDSAL